MKYYLAYGSNLNIRHMAHRCPNAAPLCPGLLQDYRLIFRNYLTIEPLPGRSVPFEVWELDEQGEQALDYYEGYPGLYRKEFLPIKADGQTLTAMVYIMNEDVYPYALPHDSYYQTVLEGYEELGFDPQILRQAMEDTRLKLTES